MHDKALCKFACVTGCGNALKYKNIIIGRQSSRAWHWSLTKCQSVTIEKQEGYSALIFL